MDDLEDVNEPSFVAESDEENNEENNESHRHQGSSGNVRDSGATQEETLSQDFDFQSQAQVVVRPRVGAAQENVPEPRPQNTETEVSAPNRLYAARYRYETLDSASHNVDVLFFIFIFFTGVNMFHLLRVLDK